MLNKVVNEKIKEDIISKFKTAKNFNKTSLELLEELKKNNFKNKHNLITIIFLHFNILELIIKIVYEIDKDKIAPYTHNIFKIYNDLSERYQKYLENEFEKINIKSKKILTSTNIKYNSFKDVLKSNENNIKNFKYTSKISENTTLLFSYINKILNKIENEFIKTIHNLEKH